MDESWNVRGGRIRDVYLEAAGIVADLLAEPAVAAAWDGPSVLEHFGVKGLAGHVFWQELALPGLLADPVPAQPVVSLRAYYLEKVVWLHADADAPVSGRIRQGGEATAADGHAALHACVREALGRLRAEVPKAPATRPVRVPSWGDGTATTAATRTVMTTATMATVATTTSVATTSSPGTTTSAATTATTPRPLLTRNARV